MGRVIFLEKRWLRKYPTVGPALGSRSPARLIIAAISQAKEDKTSAEAVWMDWRADRCLTI